MRSQRAWLPGLLILVAAVAGLPACKRADPRDPSTWTRRLAATDSRDRIEAVQRLRALGAKETAPQVASLLQDPLVREEAAAALGELGGPDQVPALLQAVATTVGAGSDQATRAANRLNARIAVALGRIGDVRAGSTLVRLVRARDEEVRLAAVDALARLRFREAIPELGHVIDDETTAPLLAQHAVQALARMDDPAAIPGLEHALVVERQGVSLAPEAAFGLFQLGPAAVGPLLNLLEERDTAFANWAMETSLPPAATIARAADVLGELGDVRAVAPLLARLRYTDADANPGTAHLLSDLVRASAARALGRLRAPAAVMPLLGMLGGARDAGADEAPDAAAAALVWIGDRAAAPELLNRAQSGSLRLRLRLVQAAALLGEPRLQKDVAALARREAAGSPETCRKQLQGAEIAFGPDDEPCEVAAALLEQAQPPLKAAAACGATPACWLEQLQNQSAPALVRARAALELGRSPAAARTVEVLGQAALHDGPPVREAAIRALEWMSGQPGGQVAAASAPILHAIDERLPREPSGPARDDLRRLRSRLAKP